MENTKWKQMWKVAIRSAAVGKLIECPIKSQQVAQSRIQDDFNKCQYAIYNKLELSSKTVSFSLDVWKAPNRKYIFAIIVY